MLFPILVFDVPLHCINEAAIEYHVPAKWIISVLRAENGRVGLMRKNKNGSYDIGPMQINSIWLPELKKYGVAEADVQFNACINVKVGAWILAKKIAKRDDVRVGVGDYHSHTYQFNKQYNERVQFNLAVLNKLLG